MSGGCEPRNRWELDVFESSTTATMDPSTSHCQDTIPSSIPISSADNSHSLMENNSPSSSASVSAAGEPFIFPIDEDVRWGTNLESQSQLPLPPPPTLFQSEESNPQNPFTMMPNSSDVTIMIEDGENPTRIIQTQHHEDIAQVLENFNSILDSIDLNYPETESLDCERDLDLQPNADPDADDGLVNDEEEYLIVVDRNKDNENNGRGSDESAGTVPVPAPCPSPVLDNEDNDNNSDLHHGYIGSDEPDPEEGYESDRPMVRASMRKLKPVQMLPMPPVSVTTATAVVLESPSHQILPGFATTLNSPLTNRILVSSLVSGVFSPTHQIHHSGGGGGGSESGNQNTMNTGNRSQCHSRSQSSNNNALILNGNPNASDLSTLVNGTAVIDLGDEPGVDSDRLNILNLNLVREGLMSASATDTAAGGETMGNSTTPEGREDGCPDFPVESRVRTNIISDHPGVPRFGSVESSGRTISNSEIVVETGGIVEAVLMGSGTVNQENPTAETPRIAENPTTTSSSATTGSRRRGSRRHSLSGGVSPGRWPHRLSSVLALIGCTLGLNNICRFGLLSVEYGANFTLQFIFLSIVFGIPLLTFHMSSGQYLASGIIDMWKISPIFQGIGIGLVISQAMIGIYTAVGVSWMFIYFRDSFITRYDMYRWAKCFRDYRDCDSYIFNGTQLAETVPDYFNGVVLQRSNSDYPSTSVPASSLKFTVAFNLAVVWMLVFVSLSKGLKSYGKVIHGFVLVPVAAMLVLASKMVGLVPSEEAGSLFGQTAWEDFFLNSQTWVIAAREAFFTWGLLGACVMQVTSHNRPTHSLKSDASIVILITLFVLLLSAFLGNACYSVLLSHGYAYVSSSFESDQTYKFLIRRTSDASLPTSMYHHTSFLMGVRIVPPSDMINTGNTVSGYQVLRLATELFPATMAVLGSEGLSPFWTVLFYFTFILFGLAQQLAIWYCVIKGVIAIKVKELKSWETTITFFVCASGFLLGLPLCTEYGIFVEYFLDYAIGSGWWIMVLYLLELVAVFIVRGAPYCGENIVTVLMTGRGKLATVLAPLISFLWNVILPVAMLVLSITSFKSGNIRELFDWNPTRGYAFWPGWTRELGVVIQLLPILCVPFVALVQSFRYLTNGPPDLFDRIQQLYRPNSRGLLGRTLSAQLGRNGGSDASTRNISQNRTSEDPPPKYTPPPSYSTATSARIAKFLRASLRRSIRRLPGGSRSTDDFPPPPNYASVILEINSHNEQQRAGCSGSRNTISIPPPSSTCASQQQQPILTLSPPLEHQSRGEGHSHDTEQMTNPIFQINLAQSHTLGRHLEPSSTDKARGSLRRIASDITPRDVARILRASFRTKNENSNNSETVETLGTNRVPGVESGLRGDGGSGWVKNYNLDFSRKRKSNDSQLALISTTQSRNDSLGSSDLPDYADLMNLGIINPTFPVNGNPSSSMERRPSHSSSENPPGPGHFRSSSLNIQMNNGFI